MTEIADFIKKNFEPVEDKPGFVWFNKRNFRIISIETLTKCLEDACGIYGDVDPYEIANGKKREE